MDIGIVGAGNIGQAVARLAVAHGHRVTLANSRGPESLAGLAQELGCTAATAEAAAQAGELVVLTIPFARVFTLDPALFAGQIVVDTNNYYPQRDGAMPALDRHEATTSGMVARHLAASRVVKAFNAIMAADLAVPVPFPSGSRRALPIAGNDPAAKQAVAGLQDEFGYDTVDAGTLDESWRFERAKPAYCIPFDEAALRAALAEAERGVELPHLSWHR